MAMPTILATYGMITWLYTSVHCTYLVSFGAQLQDAFVLELLYMCTSDPHSLKESVNKWPIYFCKLKKMALLNMARLGGHLLGLHLTTTTILLLLLLLLLITWYALDMSSNRLEYIGVRVVLQRLLLLYSYKLIPLLHGVYCVPQQV